MFQHNIKAPRIDFWNLGADKLLVLETNIKTSKKIKTHTGTSFSIIYDIKKSLEMSQYKIKATELNFQD